MTRKRRTVSISLEARGQTTQDFAVGIGIFLIAIASVFSTVPSLLTPYDSTVGAAERNQADRLADALVENLTESTDGTELESETFVERYVEDETDENLTKTLQLRESADGSAFDRVNVTLQDFDGEPITTTDGESLTAGATHRDGQPSMSAARIVTLNGDVDVGEDCDPACRLVVRVW